MRLAIITSSLMGTAAHHLPIILKNANCQIAAVIYSKGKAKRNKRYYIRRLKKIYAIGFLGAINGVRMRKWFSHDVHGRLNTDSVKHLCCVNDIPFFETETINCDFTRKLVTQANVDVGISLGNGYISKSVFSIPKFGMINIHHELLPNYKNAQSVIWQIYNQSSITGYTIHQIDDHIDTGAILKQQEVRISIQPTLRETVIETSVILLRESAKGLVDVLNNLPFYMDHARKQEAGTSYTTPSIWQFFRMVRNLRQLNKAMASKS